MSAHFIVFEPMGDQRCTLLTFCFKPHSHIAAQTLQAKLQRQNSALVPFSDPSLHPWNDILSLSLTDEATPTNTLLGAVQSKKQQKTHLAEISSCVRP